MKKKILIILSIISILFINVYDVFAFELQEYDSSVSLFDKYGYDLNLISKCDNTYYYDNVTGEIVTSTNNSKIKLCDRDSGVSLTNVKNLFKYYISIVYTDEVSGTEYNMYLVFVNQPYIKKYLSGEYIKSRLVDYNGGSNLQGLIITNISCYSEIHTDSEDYTSQFRATINGNYWSGKTHLSGFVDTNDCSNTDTSHKIQSFNGKDYDLFNVLEYNAPYITIKGYTNFDLTYYDSNESYIDATNGFIFDTDRDLKIRYNEYALLIPKRNNTFNSYIWADSNFYYDLPKYDSNLGYYDSSGAGFDEISFGYLNGFNWFKWNFTFSNEELQANKVLQIFNHNETRELNIKYFSDDFEVKLMNKDSSSFTYNGVTYSNNWEDLNSHALQHTINNTYSVDMFNDFSTYTRNLPNLIKSFATAFGFIGTLISNAFNLFSSEMLTYFYVAFGLMLIMLLIMVLK